MRFAYSAIRVFAFSLFCVGLFGQLPGVPGGGVPGVGDTFHVTGRVLVDGQPRAGVMVSFTGDVKAVSTDAVGIYEVRLPKGYTGRSSASSNDLRFQPGERFYDNVSADATGQDFQAVSTTGATDGLIISGTVRDSSGRGLNGVDLAAVQPQ